jgi:glutamyl-tRNA synthetase
VRQSEDTRALERACARLLEDGTAYPCVCTRAEVAALGAQHADDAETRYPGTCRGRWTSLERARKESGRPAGLRLRVPRGAVSVADRIVGERSFDVAEVVGDFLGRRRDGAFAYQLAVVVDDARQGVTQVLRGDDLLPSAARQALVQDALGLPHPDWVHVPLVVHADGRRLAKRRRDLALATLRESGCDARAIVAWAARASGLEGGERPSAAELVGSFDLDRLPRTPVVLSDETAAELLAAR